MAQGSPMLFVAVLIVTTGDGCGGNPVDNCNYFPDTDCCTLDSQCYDFYGSKLSYCYKPDQEHGGICSQCLEDNDCHGGGGWFCAVNDNGGQCINESDCYKGTPWPNRTACR